MTFAVWVTEDAARDLEELFDFIAGSRGTREAGYVLDHLGQVLSRSESPRAQHFAQGAAPAGHSRIPRGLLQTLPRGVQSRGSHVFVLLIADGRVTSRPYFNGGCWCRDAETRYDDRS